MLWRHPSVWWTNDIAFEVIEVDMTPHVTGRVFINEPDSSFFTNQVLHVPALTKHCLQAVTNLGPDDLKNKTEIFCQTETGISLTYKKLDSV